MDGCADALIGPAAADVSGECFIDVRIGGLGIRAEQGEQAYHLKRNELIDKHKEEVVNPWRAAELGYIDQFIRIEETRKRVAEALLPVMDVEALKPRKHKGANWPI